MSQKKLTAVLITLFSAATAVMASSFLEAFTELRKQADLEFTSKKYSVAEDKYLGAISAARKIDPPDEAVYESLSESYLNLAKCQRQTQRPEAAEATCEQALKFLRKQHYSYREPLMNELFDLYASQKKWQSALAFWSKNYSDRINREEYSFVPKIAVSGDDYSLETIRKWFKKESENQKNPQLYTDFCLTCMSLDANDYIDDMKTKNTCVMQLMAENRNSAVLPFLEERLKKVFNLGSSIVGYPENTPEELAECYRKLGKIEEAKRLEAIIQARKTYLGNTAGFNYDYRTLVDEALEAVKEKNELAVRAKLSTIKTMVEQLAYPTDLEAQTQLKSLEASLAKLQREYPEPPK
ncbi:MAG: tetratricopeptide repeat protein [Candidatus Obscuribacterales bacterium]|nr:tetratricopeptide repeat protein [Candidatus Obscuribacterales bacterium]